MARTTPVKKARRSLVWLGVIIIALVGLNFYNFMTMKPPAHTAKTAILAPKLGLDLVGGTEIILQPKVATGQTVTGQQLNQAVSIIRERIDAAGVSDSDISTDGTGGSEKVVVDIPGTLDKQTTSRITKAAQLSFRSVLLTSAATASSVGPSASATPGSTATATPTPTPSLDTKPTSVPTNGSDLAYVTPAVQAKYDSFDCKSTAAANANLAPKNQPLVTCSADGTTKFVLGPVELSGSAITNATSALVTTSTGASTGEWGVDISFNSAAGAKFEKIGNRLVGLTPPRNQFAVVLDGQVITAPVVQQSSSSPQITGSFTQTSAGTLADQLKFGALPISFTILSKDDIAPSLGIASLYGGLLAGGIGLLLVVAYSLFQYRILGAVTIASLTISAVITYLFITYLSWEADYRLSLAGVAGLIVAIGITADSFIVYFERIRDELRDGRGLESAVEAGWKRALRTVLASDSINFLASLILFILAVGSVKGFALTLGLTTIIDIVVVSLFTHPTLQLLARVRFFYEGHRLSGLDPNALGAVYRGRAQFRAPAVAGSRTGASREAARRQTIAERKAAEAEAARNKGKDS